MAASRLTAPQTPDDWLRFRATVGTTAQFGDVLASREDWDVRTLRNAFGAAAVAGRGDVLRAAQQWQRDGLAALDGFAFDPLWLREAARVEGIERKQRLRSLVQRCAASFPRAETAEGVPFEQLTLAELRALSVEPGTGLCRLAPDHAMLRRRRQANAAVIHL